MLEGVRFFTLYGRSAGSSRVRVYDWLDHLGVSDEVVTPFTDGSRAGFRQLRRSLPAALQRHRQIVNTEIRSDEVVFIQRELTPFTDGTQEAKLLRAGRRGIVDLDDGLQWDWGEGGLARSFRPKATKLLRIVESADVVIAGNETIAEWAAPHAVSVVVVPSCVESARYLKKTNYGIHGPPKLLWIGSSFSESQLDDIADLLLAAHRSTGARLTIVGDADQRRQRLEPMIDRVQWSESIAYAAPASHDIGIMPLKDGLYERAKCAYKILQYGAAGLPTLGSHVGVNAFVLNTPELSADSLLELVRTSAEIRHQVGAELRRTVECRYSFAAWADRWLEATGAKA